VKHDNCSQASKLLKQGINVNQSETPGAWSALHFAAQIGSENMVRTLLAAGADPNYIGTASGQRGTIISLKPLPVAQASLELAKSYQSNPSMTNYFAVDERLKDPKAVDRYKNVCSILDKVTSH
jgi:ankyrin repeat protein